MPGYNRNTDRFMTNIKDARTSTMDSASMMGQGYKYLMGKDGGLLGNFSSQEQNPAFANLGAAESYRNNNPNNNSAAQGLINQAYKGVAPDDYAKKASNFLEQNMGTPGQEGKGFLGGLQQMGQGINTLTGGAAGNAAKAVGSYAMENLGGNFLKEKGAQFLASKAGATIGGAMAGAGGLLAGASAVAGPLMLLKGAYDMVGASKDAYDGAVQGQENIGHMQTDVKSQQEGARDQTNYMNDEVQRLVAERRGNLGNQLSGKAEQVISAGNSIKARSNLETNENVQTKLDKNSEGIKTAYLDNSGALARQEENLMMKNIEQYGAMKNNFIAQGADLQASWDELDETRKDNKLGAKIGSTLGM